MSEFKVVIDLLDEIFSVYRLLNLHTEDGRLVKRFSDIFSVCSSCRFCILIKYYISITSTHMQKKE